MPSASAPDISTYKDKIAKVVLMPGDPLRAKWATDKFLENAKEVFSVRGITIYTGTYKGKPVSIMASGIGIPSMGIYSYELFKFCDVEVIIRVGTAGALRPDMKLLDVIVVDEAYAESTTYHKIINGSDEKVIKADDGLIEKLEKSAEKQGIALRKARCFTTEVFWSGRTAEQIIEISNADCIEMENYALFANAIKTGKKATSVLTVVDSLITGEEISDAKKVNTLEQMFQIALGIL